MASLRSAGTALLASSLFALGACEGRRSISAPENSDPSSVQRARGQGLVTQLETTTQFVGAYRGSELELEFEALSRSPLVAESTIVLDGKVFEWLWDGENGRFMLDGHDNPLTEDEQTLLAQALNEIETPFVIDQDESSFGGFPLQVAVFLGQLKWLSEYTPDEPVGQYARVVPPIDEELPPGALGQGSSARGYNYGTDVEWVWWQLRYLPACAPRGTWRTAYICPNGRCNQTRGALVNGTGGTGRSCGGNNKWNIGGNNCGDWTCQGQCGVGCQAWWHNGTYVDCFEHDVCTDWFPDAACNLDKAFAAWAFTDSYVNMRCR